MQSQGVLSIEQMCQASSVSRAGFYRGWEQKAPDQAAVALRDAIQRASLEHPRYGAAKVAEVLRRTGWVVSLTRVQRVRRQDNLLAVRRRKFVVTTDSDHDFLVYPNLAQYMVLTAVNQLWVADITYLRLASEFVYFAVVLDAFSRRALGWSVGPTLHDTLPLAALERAIAARAPGAGLVHHSDRGTQYASNNYVRRLEECKITISMSRPARPWENARCERFMRTLKEEEIDCREYGTLAELERNLEDFIDRFYNRVRLHAALGYHSPVEFEQQQAGVAALRAEIELSRLDLIKTDLGVCMTFAKVAETALSMGHREHAARTIASAEKGYSDMLRYFSQATGMTLEVARELSKQFSQLRERLDGLQRLM